MRGVSKVTCLLLVPILAITFLFSSCNKGIPSYSTVRNQESVGMEAGRETVLIPDDMDLSKEVKITGYLIGSILPGFSNVMTELNQKLKKDLNVKMEINYIGWYEMQSKYPLILAAGEDVDWVFTGGWVFYSQLAAKGAFLEITPEMLEKYMPRHYSLIKGTTALKEAKINGKVYMITTSTPDQKVPVLIYREDLRKKYGIGDIKRFSDIEPYLEAIKKNEPEMIPMNLGSTYDMSQPDTALLTEQFDFIQDILVSTGGGTGILFHPMDKDGKLYYLTQEPILSAHKKAASIMKSWYDKGYINKNAFANRIRSKESFVQGKSAIGFGNSIDIQGNIAQGISQGFEVGLVHIVTGKAGKALADSYLSNGIAIAANCKNVERTLIAMDLIMEDKAYGNLVYFGKEDVNYILEDGKIVLLSDNSTDKNSYPPDQAGFWFVNKDNFLPLASWPASFIKLKSQLKTILAPNIYAAFSPSTDDIKVEIESCNQLITQYLNPIQLGAFKNVDEAYAVLDEKLESAGIQRIMEEMTRQTKEFIESQK